MNAPTFRTFDEAVVRYFAPMAERVGLPLHRLRDGVYEIPSARFIMRIRLGIGHRKGILVTLSLPGESRENTDDLRGEIGLGNFVEFYEHEILGQGSVQDTNDFLHEAKRLAGKTEKLLVPYLLGDKNDFEAIKQMLQKKIDQSGVLQKKWNFPKNVREEWI